jgi:hypothetical protein
MLKEIMGWEYAEIQVLVAKMRQAVRDWRLYPYYEMYGVGPSISPFVRNACSPVWRRGVVWRQELVSSAVGCFERLLRLCYKW